MGGVDTADITTVCEQYKVCWPANSFSLQCGGLYM
jgi:hypothetical protein